MLGVIPSNNRVTIFRNGGFDHGTVTSLRNSLTFSLTHHNILFHETDSSSKCSPMHSSSSHCQPIKLAREDKTIVSLWLFCWTNDNYLLGSQRVISLPLLISLSIFTEVNSHEYSPYDKFLEQLSWHLVEPMKIAAYPNWF